MAGLKLTAQQERDLEARIRADPHIQQILNDPRYSTPMLKHAAVNDYLTNQVGSPLYDVNRAGGRESQRGQYSYNYDPETRTLAGRPYGTQHWWSDPGVVGPIAVGAFGGLSALGALGGSGASAAGAGTGGAGAAGVGGATTAAGGSATAAGVGGTVASALSNPWLSLIGQIPQVVGGLIGAHQAQGANNYAADLQAKAAAEQLSFLRSTEDERRREWDLQQTQGKAAWDAEQARRAPYRQAGQGALVSLSQLTGLPAPSTAVPQPTSAMGPGAPSNGQPTVSVGRRGPSGEYLDFGMGGAPSVVPMNRLYPPQLGAGDPSSMVGPAPPRRVVQFNGHAGPPGQIVIGYNIAGQPIYGNPDSNADDRWYRDAYARGDIRT